MTIDPATLHTVQVSRVGVINDKGRFIEVYASPWPIVPEPFPASRDRVPGALPPGPPPAMGKALAEPRTLSHTGERTPVDASPFFFLTLL